MRAAAGVRQRGGLAWRLRRGGGRSDRPGVSDEAGKPGKAGKAGKAGTGRLSIVNRQSPATSVSQYRDPAVNRIAERIKFLENSMSPEQRRRQELLHKGKPFYIVDPRKSKLMGYWDLTTSLALIFTAIVTPVEVAFVSMPLDRWVDPLFLINRFIDLIFTFDIGLQFVLMYPAADASEPGGERWISSFPLIAKRYLSSAWFPIDCLSIGVSFFDMFAPTGGSLSRLKGLRAIRVLRLVKLVRSACPHKLLPPVLLANRGRAVFSPPSCPTLCPTPVCSHERVACLQALGATSLHQLPAARPLAPHGGPRLRLPSLCMPLGPAGAR